MGKALSGKLSCPCDWSCSIIGLPWCDFMAVCEKTREIMLKRVYFHAHFWKFVASRLLTFCHAVKVCTVDSVVIYSYRFVLKF